MTTLANETAQYINRVLSADELARQTLAPGYSRHKTENKTMNDTSNQSLRLSAIAVGCLAIFANAAFASDPTAGDQAWQKLLEGNQRYVANAATHPDQTPERRAEVAKGQKPFAIILTCADSRVGPEVVFDQGLGDLFVLRNAGNVLDDHTIGSIEYAVEHLHAPLIVVLGHSSCGAVSAAVGGGHAPGHIHSIVEAIEPAVAETKHQSGDKIENTVRANARRVAEILRQVEPIISESVKEGKLKIVAARYDLSTGRVELLP